MMPDAVSLLTAEHKRVKKLLRQLEETKDSGDRTELLLKIAAVVTLHSQATERVFYPAYHAAIMNDDQEAVFFEAQEQHRIVSEVLGRAQRLNAGSPEFKGVTRVLASLIEHLADVEETEMFPRAKKLMSEEQLTALGARIEASTTSGRPKLFASARTGQNRLT
jgi:hemerythrin superfamily protein